MLPETRTANDFHSDRAGAKRTIKRALSVDQAPYQGPHDRTGLLIVRVVFAAYLAFSAALVTELPAVDTSWPAPATVLQPARARIERANKAAREAFMKIP